MATQTTSTLRFGDNNNKIDLCVEKDWFTIRASDGITECLIQLNFLEVASLIGALNAAAELMLGPK